MNENDVKQSKITTSSKPLTREEIFAKYGLKTVRTTHKSGTSVIFCNRIPKR